MLLVRGAVDDTELTGTIYEVNEEPPVFSGTPDEGAPYVWICDEFYEVESGANTQVIDGREVDIAFESPMPRGFMTRNQAIRAAKEHVRTQFSRVGVDPSTVRVEVVEKSEAAPADQRLRD